MKTIVLHETYIGTQFPCALEYGDNTGLYDGEERQLDNWYSNLVNEAEDRYTANPSFTSSTVSNPNSRLVTLQA